MFEQKRLGDNGTSAATSMHRWIPTHGHAHIPLEACKRAVSYVRFRTDLRENLP